MNQPVVSAQGQEKLRKQEELEAQRRLLLRRRETQKGFDEAAQKSASDLATRFGNLFEQLDSGHTGTLSAAQFEAGTRSWGYKFSDVTLSTILSSFGATSTISKPQFLGFMHFFADGRQRFRQFDSDNSDSIDKTELAKLLSVYKFSERVISDLVSLFNSKDHQALEFGELMSLLISLRDLEHHISVRPRTIAVNSVLTAPVRLARDRLRRRLWMPLAFKCFCAQWE